MELSVVSGGGFFRRHRLRGSRPFLGWGLIPQERPSLNSGLIFVSRTSGTGLMHRKGPCLDWGPLSSQGWGLL